MNIVLIYRMIHAAFALITLFFITTFLTPIEQGWYYAFLSFAALIHLFDFGLSSALVHIGAIEFSSFKWGVKGNVDNDSSNIYQNLINIAFHKYLILGFWFFISIFPFGILYFSENPTSEQFQWLIPWFILCLSSLLYLLCFPFLSLIEGSGNIIEIYYVKIIQLVFGSIFCWLFIYHNHPLYASSMMFLFIALISFFWILIFRPKNIPKKILIKKEFNWHKISNFKNKVGFTYLGLYLFTQIYTPILFYLKDPSIAGKYGLTLAIANMLGLLSGSWMAFNIPKMTKAVTNKNLDIFFVIFKNSFFQSTTFLLVSIFITIFIYTIIDGFYLTDRLLGFFDFTGVLFIILMTHIITSFVVFFRCFKSEPLVFWHIFLTIITLLLGIIIIVNFSITYLIICILFSQVFLFLPISFSKWHNFKKNLAK